MLRAYIRPPHHARSTSVEYLDATSSEIREVIGPIFTPNGVGLAPDGRTLYVAETETGRVWSWEVTGPGEVRKRPWPSPHGGTLVSGPAGLRPPR